MGRELFLSISGLDMLDSTIDGNAATRADVFGFLTIFIFSIKITDSFGLRRLCNKWVGFIFAGLGN